jgi:hypothetical protein
MIIVIEIVFVGLLQYVIPDQQEDLAYDRSQRIIQ